MKIGFYQYRPVFGNVSHNLNKVVKKLGDVQADLIVLPELAFTGYYFKDRAEVMKLAEDPGKSTTVDTLTALCKKKKLHLVTGFTEKAKNKYFNSALLIGPKGVEHIYRKIHLFNEETKWFDDGDVPLQVNKIGNVRIGIMICFD